MGDVLRRVRVLHNIGLLELSGEPVGRGAGQPRIRREFARTGRLVDLWALAPLNLGASSEPRGASTAPGKHSNEALRLSAELQQTELQLIITYNLGHLARELRISAERAILTST